MIAGVPDDAESLAVGALGWLMRAARDTGDGVGWPDTPADEQVKPRLYDGSSGVLPTLLDAWRYFDDDRYADMALRGARSVAGAVGDWEDSGLYSGVAGMAVALRGVHRVLGDAAAGAAADRALDVLRSRYDGSGWNDWFELVVGNAGIALAALECGDPDLAQLAVERYARTAEPTPAGVQWQVQTGRVHRMLHLSHGTLGIVYALAAVGRAAGRPDLVDLALAGTADVVSRNEAGPDGFLVPYSDPQQRHERIERHNYGWCHGPAGDAQAFRLLAQVLPDDPTWPALADRCWRTVVDSGLPRRIRPGFWDNNGRCCGSAGVLALACDRQVERGDGRDFADLLVADLAARATADAEGVRWSNVEHRDTPSDLAPATGWAMANAGIVRELLRQARITTNRDPRYAVPFPDHPPAVPFGPHHEEEPVSYPRPLTPEEKLADAKKRLGLPRIVVICGSTRFMAEMAEADLRETEAGRIVVKPGCDMKSPHDLWSDPVKAEALKVRLDDLHRAKIRLADEVLVVGDYIGDSTRAEIAYARSLDKPVRFTHPEVDPGT